MKKDLVILLGWGSIKESYTQFIKLAPDNWQITLIESAELLDNSFNDPTVKLVQKLKELNIKKCYLVGHSLGGAIALQTALKFPNKIEHLYLINTEGVYEQINFLKTAIAYVQTGFHNFRNEGVLFLKALTKIIPRPWYSYKLGKYAHNQDLIEAAKKITVPTTIIWGDKDIVLPVHQGEKLHQAISRSRLIVLKGYDHNWIINYPEHFWLTVIA